MSTEDTSTPLPASLLTRIVEAMITKLGSSSVVPEDLVARLGDIELLSSSEALEAAIRSATGGAEQ